MHGSLADLYRHLHTHPELAFAEKETAALIASRVKDLGYEVTEGVGVTGVVAMLRNGPGPTILLRADMDALPLQERTGAPYASVNEGVMHACGHDMHVTWLIGALEILQRDRADWSGTIMAVFQPAEEGGSGAKVMVEDGLFARFGTPDVALGQHVAGPLAAGMIGYRPGPAMAASDAFKVRLFGRGGHGSRPESTVDPVVMAAATVMRLQTIVSREVSPIDTAVITVGAIHAGTTTNIIAPEAELLLTTRAFSSGVRDRMHDALRRIIRAEAEASGAPAEPEITITGSYPVLINDPAATERTIAAIGAELGADQFVEMPLVMGAEDFGTYGTVAGVPSCFWFVGGSDPERFAQAEAAGRIDEDIPSNHSPLFAPVIEPTLSVGVRAMVAAAREWLK
ncbi:MAG TPA: amidohydrolase [Micromonosporaceae bacterium]|nr:amidohydrolase [Micromonosporaceae bacterium]